VDISALFQIWNLGSHNKGFCSTFISNRILTSSLKSQSHHGSPGKAHSSLVSDMQAEA
jgi:hypothetical protein